MNSWGPLNANNVAVLLCSRPTMSTSDSGYDIERGAPESEKKLPQVPEELFSDVLGMSFVQPDLAMGSRPFQLHRCLCETFKLN